MLNYKVSASSNEDSAADALEHLNLDEDDISDDYDFMEDAEGQSNGRRRASNSRNREPRRKYLEVLQKVADREISEICIDLDDLAEVLIKLRGFYYQLNWHELISGSTKQI